MIAAVKSRGVLRHLGIRYANFVTGGGDGFDVELMRLFATHLGVRYQFVETDWPSVLPDFDGTAGLRPRSPIPRAPGRYRSAGTSWRLGSPR